MVALRAGTTTPTTMGGRSEFWLRYPNDCQDGMADIGNRYIRSHMDLDDLERMARYPPVDPNGVPTKKLLSHQAGAAGE